jgi:ELWxxDGT repeat protein
MANFRVVFSGTDDLNHDNLWVTDGTGAGTSELTRTGGYSNEVFYNGLDPSFTVFGTRAFFKGYDSSFHVGLWVTNGASGGTSELAVANAYSGGLFSSVTDPSFTVLGSKTFFQGYDSNAHLNLWVTDGTSVGTSELQVAGANSLGLFAASTNPSFTVLGTRVLFEGYDTGAKRGLWVTDGTGAGTSEVQVNGAYSSGLFTLGDPHFTVLGGKALFAGTDSSAHRNLWVTDGTTAGTSELTPGGSYSIGLLYSLGDPYFTILGNKVLFKGWDSSAHLNLWVTDGTTAGTSELTVSGAYASGLLYHNAQYTVDPDFTLFGSKALFVGEDVSGNFNIWSTDGTSAGTNELTAVGANSHGLFYNGSIYAISDLTVLGGKALFAGFDSNGHINLWVTDGTSGGTSELTVTNADPSGLFYNNGTALNPDFTVVGNKVLFEGYDVNGHVNLWVTDGTATGTSELAVTGAYSGGLASGHFTVLSNLPASSDFNNDGRSDFLWQNSSGEADIWELNGISKIASSSLGNPGSSWHAKSTGDFNADGNADILWQNSSGEAYIWEMNGTTQIGGGSLGNPGPSWHEVATGDFNKDGYSDILWQNSTGEVYIWELNGTTVIGKGSVGNPGPSWHAIATGDFNADGYADILWQNSSGEVDIWELNGTTVIGSGSLGNPGPSWHAITTGDFNNDGYSDILWQNDNGEVKVWEVSGTTVIGSGSVGNPGPSWHVIGSGDYNGDGYSDIRFQNSSGEADIWELNGTTVIANGSLGNPGPRWHLEGDSSPYRAGNVDLVWQSDVGATILFQNDSGEGYIWQTNGTAQTGGVSLGNPGPSWHLKATGDFNADGNPDLLWQNDSGEVTIWEVDGINVIGNGSLGNPGPDWHVKGTGDFNYDGLSDILWQNDSGEVAIWDLNGTTVLGKASLGNPGSSWHVKGTGNFFGNGRSDILFQNDSGEAYIWEINGTTQIGGGSLGNPGASWHVMGSGDYNGDGRSDILWQNSSGAVSIWEMNGTSVLASSGIGNPGPTWHA